MWCRRSTLWCDFGLTFVLVVVILTVRTLFWLYLISTLILVKDIGMAVFVCIVTAWPLVMSPPKLYYNIQTGRMKEGRIALWVALFLKLHHPHTRSNYKIIRTTKNTSCY